MVYPDLSLVRCRRLDRATWIIIGNFDCHFFFRVLHIWGSIFLSLRRPHSLVGFLLALFQQYWPQWSLSASDRFSISRELTGRYDVRA